VGKALRRIQAAVENGGGALAEFSKVLGISGDEIQKLLDRDASKVFELLIQRLSELSANGGKVSVTLKKLGLDQDRTVKSLAPLIANYARFRQVIDTANDEAIKQTSLIQESDRAFNTFNSRIKTTFNSMADLAQIIGRVLAPAVDILAAGITKTANFLSNAIGSLLDLGKRGVTPTIAVIEALTARQKFLREGMVRLTAEGRGFLDGILSTTQLEKR